MKKATEKATYSATDLREYLGISLVGAYNLMESKDFPSFRIGRRILVMRADFEKWLVEQQNKKA